VKEEEIKNKVEEEGRRTRGELGRKEWLGEERGDGGRTKRSKNGEKNYQGPG
jgi:hypothetical protein